MGGELSVQTYEELIEHTVDILTVLDESGTIQYESPSAERVIGYSPEELVGENAFEYIHPEDQQEALEIFHQGVEASKAEGSKSAEFRFQHKDNSWVWLETRGVTQKSTMLGGYVLSSRDISKQKEAEQKFKQERDRLDRFTSIISHDLRNPLSVVSGRLQLAHEDCDSEHLNAMEGALDRMDELIEDLLTVAREGQSEPVLDSVPIREVVEACWQNINRKDATLNIHTEQILMADERKFQQVLENLFRNAIEHGGEDVTVTVGALDDGFYVADDGRGIPEEDRDSLLEYGFSTKTDGTGFGLSIVNEIVENHDWNLNITEGIDGGARFEIRNVRFV